MVTLQELNVNITEGEIIHACKDLENEKSAGSDQVINIL